MKGTVTITSLLAIPSAQEVTAAMRQGHARSALATRIAQYSVSR